MLGLTPDLAELGWHFRGDAIKINKEVRNFHRAVTHAKTKQEKEEANEALTAYVAERRVAVAAALSARHCSLHFLRDACKLSYAFASSWTTGC